MPIDNNSNARSSNFLDAYNVPDTPLALYNLRLCSLQLPRIAYTMIPTCQMQNQALPVFV